MKAIVRDHYGSPDVLRWEEVPKPTAGEDQVLVEVRAASANPADWHSLRGSPLFLRLSDGLFRPKSKTLGIDIAGRVEAVGNNVTQFQPGDEVFGASPYAGFAEYTCASEDRLASKPNGTTFEQAAAVPVAAVSALQALRDTGGVQPGQEVLIKGASGGVGTFAVQIAKAFEAEVTGVCSGRNLDLVRSLGADHVVDYTQEDYTRRGRRYDLIVDCAAYRSVSRNRKALRPGGKYVMVGGAVNRFFHVVLLGLMDRRMSFMLARMTREALLSLKELLEAGKIVPVIDRRYSLQEVPEALRYLEKGHARGKVVLTV